MFQKNNLLFTWLFLILLWNSLYAQYTKESYIDESITEQLSKDETFLPMEKGAVFVPYIFDSQREPLYTIFSGSKFIKDAHPGERVILDPGEYILYIGSGPLDSRLKKKIVVEKERITVIKPEWSALIIRTVDEFNTGIRQGFQIINEESKIVLATGSGADEAKGEKASIWIVMPGLYRITTRDESPDSTSNFVTVRTIENHLSDVRLVFQDDTSNTILGGGEVISDLATSGDTEGWSLRALITGNFSYNQSYKSSVDTSSYSFGSNFNGVAIYDTSSYYFRTKLDVYENFMKDENDNFASTRDLLRLQTIGVKRLGNIFGLYLSLQADTNIFGHKKDFGSDTALKVIENDGSFKIINDGDDFKYDSSFSPLVLQEGVGLNLDFKYGHNISLTARTGWGFKQNIFHNSYDIERDTVATPEYEIYRVKTLKDTMGPEFNLLLIVMPFSFIEFQEEFVSLVPIEDTSAYYYRSETTVSLWISSFVRMQYYFSIKRDVTVSEEAEREQALMIQFYYNFF